MKIKTDNPEISSDSLFDGELICFQNVKGYRFSIDSVLLANYCSHWKNASILDLGCGCGILGLILLYRNNHNIQRVTGIEYQQSLVKLAEKNIYYNNMKDKFSILSGDFRELSHLVRAESFSHVICNPPFYKLGNGRPSENEEAYIARHQVAATPDDIAQAISFALKNKGIAALIYPADPLMELLERLQDHNLEPKILQMVYSYPEAQNATLTLLECTKNGGKGLKVKQPVYIYREKNGSYTDKVKAMYLANKESHSE